MENSSDVGDLDTINGNDLYPGDFEILDSHADSFLYEICRLFSNENNEDVDGLPLQPLELVPGNQGTADTLPECDQKGDSHNNNAPTFINITDNIKTDFIQNMRNKNTVRKTESAMKQFTTWLKQEPRNETREVNKMNPSELDNYIGSFLLSIRKADGSDYEPDTLTSYHRSIDRYLRENKYPFSLVNDKEFATSRTVLISKRKELKQKGKGGRPNAAEPLTKSEENILKEKGCIGLHSPKALLNKIWLQNTMMFGIRGGTENQKLRWSDIQLKKDENDREYLEYRERETKTRTGELSTHLRAFRPKQFAVPDDPSSCPVATYKAFRHHRPTSTMSPDSPFYVAINYKRAPDSHIWYKNQPLGENSLRSIMREMAKNANLPGKKTNHSARKSTCTKLLHAGIAPTTIQQLTGHKNVQSINNYAVASVEMQKTMSDILSNKESKESTSCVSTYSPPRHPPTASATSMPSVDISSNSSFRQSTSAGELFANAKMMNCTININNYGSNPPQKRKRIRVIESDDSE
ncbi:uncharacterized protein KIAA1958-like [Ostrea edulis]|uniref:uncharacterized protein KIAA1958-like n=1 Tax=Ostrea edulis TaxID=37623 RepID=UPI0024AFB3C2|nr:uncharacterized protein KIAA1958-like [Ostrea edulis]